MASSKSYENTCTGIVRKIDELELLIAYGKSYFRARNEEKLAVLYRDLDRYMDLMEKAN